MTSAQKRTVQSLVRTIEKASTGRNDQASNIESLLNESGRSAVHGELAEARPLSDFRATGSQLGKADRLTLVDQAIVLIDQNYVHRPLKEAMYAVRPVQQLKLLRQRVEACAEDKLPLAYQFHQDMLEVFASVRDLHTNFILPPPFSGMVAFLPFLVEEFGDIADRKYLVSHVVQGSEEPPFERGVEVLSWNGIPIARAVAINAQRFAGSNAEARRARGVERLTIRPLILSMPPDEDWVVLGYKSEEGQEHELRVYWQVAPMNDARIQELREQSATEAPVMGFDIDSEMASQARKILFAPKAVAAERAVMQGAAMAASEANLSRRPEMSARVTPDGRFAHVRIWTLASRIQNEPFQNFLEEFTEEFARLAKELPQEGLIIDVRGNGGGVIYAGEMLLQLLTPRRIEPERLQFINTALNLDLCRRNGQGSGVDLSNWTSSIQESLLTGAVYSRAFPITPVDLVNNIGQVYHGPVVLITDARCYSTTDIFAAGFQDHNIGRIIGVDLNTGAGGANVWTHDLLRQLMPDNSPYQALPGQVQMRVAIRQTLRVGKRSGTLLEDLGVVPDEQHALTRDDLLNDNVDLIAFAGSILEQMPVRRLRVEFIPGHDGTRLARVGTLGIERLDVYADDRPLGSVDVGDGDNELEMQMPSSAEVRFEGFKSGELVAVRRVPPRT